MIIRRETEEDFTEIYNLVKTAFQTAKVSNGKEQEFVEQLRSGDGYIPEFALVAEEEGKLIGHVMLTITYVINGHNKVESLLLAPLSVALEHRDKGIGSTLVNESMKLAKLKGYSSIFLVGDPNYYGRFGFKTTAPIGIKCIYDEVPDDVMLYCELTPGALRGVVGKVEC
jgi:predicted N-acetyltransferase YhbS